MDEPESGFHFKLMPLAFKLMDIFPPRKNILNEVGIKPGFHFIEGILGAKPGIFMEYASKMEGYV